MDFGLLYEITIPRPWGERTERDAYHNIIDQAVLAEQVGFSNFWTVEHHFLEEFSHCSAPEALYGAIAARTSTLRIGNGVKLLPFNYNHPIRAAEAAAVVDLVSDGRLEFGTGRSLSHIEMEGFGIDPNDTRAQWEESLRMIVEAWTNEAFQWSSPSYTIPQRSVVPKPLQKPHPPLWVACTSPDSHEMAGRFGLGLLSFTIMVPLEEIERRMGLYQKALKTCTPIGKFVNDRTALLAITHCAETDEEARETAAHFPTWYIRSSIDYISRLAAWQSGRDMPTYEYAKEAMKVDLDRITFEYLHNRDMCCVGSPDTIIEKLKKFEALGFTQVITHHDGYGLTPEQVSRSIELYGKYVIPEFQ